MISVPSIQASPRVGRSSPARRCISVDLPDPEGPSPRSADPRSTASETPRSASTAVSLAVAARQVARRDEDRRALEPFPRGRRQRRCCIHADSPAVVVTARDARERGRGSRRPATDSRSAPRLIREPARSDPGRSAIVVTIDAKRGAAGYVRTMRAAALLAKRHAFDAIVVALAVLGQLEVWLGSAREPRLAVAAGTAPGDAAAAPAPPLPAGRSGLRLRGARRAVGRPSRGGAGRDDRDVARFLSRSGSSARTPSGTRRSPERPSASQPSASSRGSRRASSCPTTG